MPATALEYDFQIAVAGIQPANRQMKNAKAKSRRLPVRGNYANTTREFLRHPLPCVMMAASLFKETNGRVFARFAKSGVKVIVVADENFNSVLQGICYQRGQGCGVAARNSD